MFSAELNFELSRGYGAVAAGLGYAVEPNDRVAICLSVLSLCHAARRTHHGPFRRAVWTAEKRYGTWKRRVDSSRSLQGTGS